MALSMHAHARKPRAPHTTALVQALTRRRTVAQRCARLALRDLAGAARIYRTSSCTWHAREATLVRSILVSLAALGLTAACSSSEPSKSTGSGAGAGAGAGTSGTATTTGTGASGTGGHSSSAGTGGGGGGSPPSSGCFALGKVPLSVSPSGFAILSLDDERNTYKAWGLTWSPDAEPNIPAEPDYAVSDPDIHGN